MVAQSGYDEIATLLANMDPAKLLSTKASPAFQERLDVLLNKNQDGEITEDERVEVEHYVIINRLFTVATIKVFQMDKQ